MSRTLEFAGPLYPERVLPIMRSHAEWCRHLARRGSLAPNHRACTQTLRCVADKIHVTPDAWRTNRPA